MNDIALLDATAQAELVRSRQVNPIELVEAAIERIERLNPKVNAVVTQMYDIDRQDLVKTHEGKRVRIQGTLDSDGKTIHVK